MAVTFHLGRCRRGTTPGADRMAARFWASSLLPLLPLLACAVPVGGDLRAGEPVVLFSRGDANADARVDVSDPVFTLLFLFAGGEDPTCLDAADANDDGAVDISDSLATLGRLFLGSGELPPPAPGTCGPDPTSDALGCARYAPCGKPPPAEPPSRPEILFVLPEVDRIRVRWLPSEDDATTPGDIVYEVHLAAEEVLDPSPETLAATVRGETTIDVAELGPGLTYRVTVVAVDEDEMRSAATSTVVVSTPDRPLVFRDDVRIVDLATLSSVGIDGDQVTFPQGEIEPPAVGDFLSPSLEQALELGEALLLVKGVEVVGGNVRLTTSPDSPAAVIDGGVLQSVVHVVDIPPEVPWELGEDGLEHRRAVVAPGVAVEESRIPLLRGGGGDASDESFCAEPAESGAFVRCFESHPLEGLTLAGKFTFTPVVTGSFELDPPEAPEITHLDFLDRLRRAGVTIGGDLAFEGLLRFQSEANKEWPYEPAVPFFRRSAIFRYMLWGVPVIQRVVFTLNWGVNAEASASVDASYRVRSDTRVTATATWNGLFPEVTHEVQGPSLTAEPSLNVAGDFAASARLIITLKTDLYRLVEGSFSLEPSLAANLSVETGCGGPRLSGAEVTGGIEGKLSGAVFSSSRTWRREFGPRTLFDPTFHLFRLEEYVVAEGDGRLAPGQSATLTLVPDEDAPPSLLVDELEPATVDWSVACAEGSPCVLPRLMEHGLSVTLEVPEDACPGERYVLETTGRTRLLGQLPGETFAICIDGGEHEVDAASPPQLRATTVSESAIDLEWEAPAGSCGYTYAVHRAQAARFEPSPANRIATGLSTRRYRDAGLALCSTYHYRVMAVGPGGDASASEIASATTSCPLNVTARLRANGNGRKVTPDGDQEIGYRVDSDLTLRCRRLGPDGGDMWYEVEEVNGSHRFRGTAVDRPFGFTWHFDFDRALAQQGVGGFLAHSMTAGEVRYVGFPVRTSGDQMELDGIEYFGDTTPHFLRSLILLQSRWRFGTAFDNCPGLFNADLRREAAVIHGGSARRNDGFQFQGENWKLTRVGGALEADFLVDPLPASAILTLRHLTSAADACPNRGFSPVDLIINGRVLAPCYDPAQHHEGSHAFVTDTWDVASFLRQGRNLVTIVLCETACTQYWIDWLRVGVENADCASCELRAD